MEGRVVVENTTDGFAKARSKGVFFFAFLLWYLLDYVQPTHACISSSLGRDSSGDMVSAKGSIMWCFLVCHAALWADGTGGRRKINKARMEPNQ